MNIKPIIQVSFGRAFIIMAAAVMFSCQKVINIDLNTPSPQLVVEASISDKPGPYFVKLSKTVSFDDITSIPAVRGATVELSDSSGGSEVLTELRDGIYSAGNITGQPGHLYKLKIQTGGQLYEAFSRMPYPVDGFNLSITPETDYHPDAGNSGGPQPPGYQVDFTINDPLQYENFYRFVVYRNNRQISSRRVFSDHFHNGKTIADQFGLHDSISFNPGEFIVVELQNIDNSTYNFFRTLRDGAGSLTFLSASPSNPISNISNNGLGYFSAYASNERISIIPK